MAIVNKIEIFNRADYGQDSSFLDDINSWLKDFNHDVEVLSILSESNIDGLSQIIIHYKEDA